MCVGGSGREGQAREEEKKRRRRARRRRHAGAPTSPNRALATRPTPAQGQARWGPADRTAGRVRVPRWFPLGRAPAQTLSLTPHTACRTCFARLSARSGEVEGPRLSAPPPRPEGPGRSSVTTGGSAVTRVEPTGMVWGGKGEKRREVE